MRIRFRAALATAVAALGLVAGSVAPAQAATGYDRCPKGRFCIFDGRDGTGAMASYSTVQTRLGSWDNRASSVYNRTSYKNVCLFTQPYYKYEDSVHDIRLEMDGTDFRMDLAHIRDANSHMDNNLSSFRWAATSRECETGTEYLPWENPTWSSRVNHLPFGDLDGDGNADLLQRTHTGRLWFLPGNGSGRAISSGWNSMTALTRHGDLTGDGREDLLARNKQGVLTLYAGNGKGAFPWHKAIGSGWNSMTAIQAAGDLSGDGRMDLVARNKQGVLTLYSGDGKGAFPWHKAISSGWNGMLTFAAPGDLSGDRHDDLVAGDSAGKLWLYPGNGHGGFTARKLIGSSGWRSFTTILGVGDMATPTGRPDIIAAQSGEVYGSVRLFSGQPGGKLQNLGDLARLDHGDLLR
ncbi:FG-GAP-like repeat-containing protein [Streptomyces sp. NPDC046977]|uniref:FG-GAP-like repeat-containing protein n=1 Tax=Streptomyces sp. NPDC046977 TaxID=3154703 RepID=UPI0033C6E201